LSNQIAELLTCFQNAGTTLTINPVAIQAAQSDAIIVAETASLNGTIVLNITGLSSTYGVDLYDGAQFILLRTTSAITGAWSGASFDGYLDLDDPCSECIYFRAHLYSSSTHVIVTATTVSICRKRQLYCGDSASFQVSAFLASVL
jgi:hypothetical protein